MNAKLTLGELTDMRADLIADIEEMQTTLAWVVEQIAQLPPERQKRVPARADGRRGYTKLDVSKLRTFIQKFPESTISAIATALKVSEGQVRYKCEQLYEQGTLVRIKKKNRVHYSIAKPARPNVKGPAKKAPALKVVGGTAVPGTGKDRQRRAEVRKGRRGYR